MSETTVATRQTDEPEMGEFGPRTKRQYAALSGITGLRPPFVAKFFGITQQSVSRWERDGYHYPPRQAWELVESSMKAHLRAVETAVATIEDAYKHDDVKVLLTYYRNEHEYYVAHQNDNGGVKHAEIMWALADARAKAIGTELMMDGYPVEFVRPGGMPDGHDDGVMVVPRR